MWGDAYQVDGNSLTFIVHEMDNGIFPLETSRVCTGTWCRCCWVEMYVCSGDIRGFIFELECQLWNLQQRPRYNWAQICIEKDHLFESTAIWVMWILGRTETRGPSILVS